MIPKHVSADRLVLSNLKPAQRMDPVDRLDHQPHACLLVPTLGEHNESVRQWLDDSEGAGAEAAE
jgi:hypothetical protein